MGKPRQPKAPDPIATGAAQTSTNVATAIANQIGNMTNQVTPYGTLSYGKTGEFRFTDPNSGKSYDLPTFTATQSLTPAGQRIQDNTIGAQTAMSGAAQSASQRMQGLMGGGIDLSGVPGRASMPTLSRAPTGDYNARGDIADAGQITRGIVNAGGVTRTYNGDFSADRQRVESALMSRLNPQLQNDRASREAQLRQQGITLGSAAYDRAMAQLDQQSNDARMQAILAGGQEQSRMVGLEAQRAGFENAAQQQVFGQHAAEAAFWNDAQSRQFAQNQARLAAFNDAQAANYRQAMGGSAFNNQAALDQYRMADAARSGAIQEQVGLRNQQINEVQSLLGGSQLQTPNFVNAPGLSLPTTDYAGLKMQGYNNQMNAYQQQLNNWNGLWGGLLGGGTKILTGRLA